MVRFFTIFQGLAVRNIVLPNSNLYRFMSTNRMDVHESQLASDPLEQLKSWVNLAAVPGGQPMALSTADSTGKPSVRMVLLKGIDERGLRFFTHTTSRKGVEMQMNPQVAVLMYWPEFDAQARIEGTVTQTSAQESDQYFRSRDRKSQIGAWASEQSKPVLNREALDSRVEQREQEFEGKDVPRPPHWCGHVVSPVTMEFWKSGESRLHDRIVYSKTEGGWTKTRLSP